MGPGHNDNSKIFQRRAFLLAGLNLVLMGVLAGRLTYLQIFQSQKYQMLADENRINIKLIKPERGEILDRKGRRLAMNKQNFSLLIVPERTPDFMETLGKIGRLIPLPDHAVSNALKIRKKQRSFVPIVVRERLTWEEMATIEVNLVHLPGVSVEENRRRYYPEKEVAAHTVGYVSAVSASEIDKNPVLTIPGFQIGKTGIEKHHEKRLQGLPGQAQEEVNARGRKVRELERNEAAQGQDLYLSLDVELQRYTFEKMKKHHSGSVIVMDANTGAVYASVSVPSYDANLFTDGLSPSQWEALLSNPEAPLINKAIAGQYPPGSTFKMVTALSALENKIIRTNHKETCQGFIEVGNHKFHCWKRGGHGVMNLKSALSESCDVFFYNIAREVGMDKISETAKNLGLGVKHDMDIAGEKQGLVPTRDWKQKHRGEEWKIGDTILASIGQGLVQTTPMQLAIMLAQLVNGGYKVTPQFIKPELHGEIVREKLPFEEKYLKLIKEGMNHAVNHQKGTAFGSRLAANTKMGGKTGTAQVRRITAEQREAGFDVDEMPWRLRHHALFVGYAPEDNPRYIVSVIAEHGSSGSRTAAPLARDIMTKTLQLSPRTNV